MEGLYFEVKTREEEEEEERSSDNHSQCFTSCRVLSRRSSSLPVPGKLMPAWRNMAAISPADEGEDEEEAEVRYKLTLIGSLTVHSLTTAAMLPWVVAEISQAQKKAGGPGPSTQTVFLCVSVSWVRCVSVLGEGVVWDPLTHTPLFECSPQQVTKLIHNSQEPSSFGCLLRDAATCACYVFQCQDSTKVSVCVCVCVCVLP